MADLAWFPFYVDRFLSSRRTRTMTPEQVGIYLLLLCEQWDHGAVPDEPAEIEDIARAPHSQAMAVLERCFTRTNTGWVNGPMEDIRAEQETRSERLAEAGRRGAAKRYGPKAKKPGHSQATDSQAIARPKPPHSIREEERREEEKRKETAVRPPAEGAHPELSTFLGSHADSLTGVDMMAQRSVWGIWGPHGTNAHEWRGMAPGRQAPILATAILSWRAGKPERFYRPFFAKILARAIDDAIASERQAEQAGTEQAMANDLRAAARAKEEAEIARLNREAESMAPTQAKSVSGPRGTGLARVQA